jgi:hypothetical protein
VFWRPTDIRRTQGKPASDVRGVKYARFARVPTLAQKIMYVAAAAYRLDEFPVNEFPAVSPPSGDTSYDKAILQ